MPLGSEVGVDPGDIMLDGDPAAHGKGHSSPHFSAHDYCGQMAGGTKMPLGIVGTEVDRCTKVFHTPKEVC